MKSFSGVPRGGALWQVQEQPKGWLRCIVACHFAKLACHLLRFHIYRLLFLSHAHIKKAEDGSGFVGCKKCEGKRNTPLFREFLFSGTSFWHPTPVRSTGQLCAVSGTKQAYLLALLFLSFILSPLADTPILFHHRETKITVVNNNRFLSRKAATTAIVSFCHNYSDRQSNSVKLST